jgi:predicted ATPase
VSLKTLKFHPVVTFLVGENGTGKSTLLEAIVVSLRINPEGGSKNSNFSTRSTDADLHEYLLRRTSYKQTDHCLLTKDFLDDPDYMLKRLFEEE